MKRPHDPNTPFHWQGKPSIFTQGDRAYKFKESDVKKNLDTSLRDKPICIGLPGGSPFRAPGLMKKSY